MNASATVARTGSTDTAAPMVHRIEVRPTARAGDPVGESVRARCASIGVQPKSVSAARVYLVRAPLTPAQVQRVRHELLEGAVLEESVLGAAPVRAGAQIVEVLPLPGVMDPAAQTVAESIRVLLGLQDAEVITGWRYDLEGVSNEETERVARQLLANPVIEAIHRAPHQPTDLPRAAPADQRVRTVSIIGLNDEQLMRLSREGHLFLSLDEMRAIQAEFRRLAREPRDIELETLAQTWSEHCVHKTLKSTVTYRPASGTAALSDDVIKWEGRPGHTINADGSVTIHNLLKSTVAAATHELIAEGVDWTLSVFKDNAGVIRFDDKHAVCVKVETHNHPSAIEPYGGAATGVGGCIRDVMGTGLGAKPIANTDVFCVAFPDAWSENGSRPATAGAVGSRGATESLKALPPGCLHPRRVLNRVVDGVRDYGNRMGIPTVNGAVWFDDRYIGNPLVFCGCVGLMPSDKVTGGARAGDVIVALGGRTGRDGIHGATFSSAELTHTHADEFSHAVQIGNAIEEKRTLDAILRARDDERGCLFSAITDCGAGGFSSAVGEMGSTLGALVHLERAPLKYAGLRYDEIWISESQERMVLAVPPENLAALRAICDEERVEMCELGTFGCTDERGQPLLRILFHGEEVGALSMHFLHDGIPMPVREAEWGKPRESGVGNRESAATSTRRSEPGTELSGDEIKATLLRLLAHPNIASKRWIVRQYDHEVQGNTVIKPLVGPLGSDGPGDAAVIAPVAGSNVGVAIACGLATPVGDPALGGDPYLMALAAVDECVRNLVCVGADPDRIAILDNFCWPSCAKPENMGALVRAAEGCYDAAKAYRTPFVSGKDSLNNQFRYRDEATGKDVVIEIPPTLLISGIGIVPDVRKCVTMEAKATPNGKGALALIGLPRYFGNRAHRYSTCWNVVSAHVVHALIERGFVVAAHDVSDGGALVAIAEMLIAAGDSIGATIEDFALLDYEDDPNDPDSLVAYQSDLFDESPGRYIVQLSHEAPMDGSIDDCIYEAARDVLSRLEPDWDVQHELLIDPMLRWVGTLNTSGELLLEGHLKGVKPRELFRIGVADLRRAFFATLDW